LEEVRVTENVDLERSCALAPFDFVASLLVCSFFVEQDPGEYRR
jgi:hypothetical protein